MKDRIQELFDQVMDSPDPLRRFAELVRQDERQALAQPEQEPVAWLYNGHLHECDPSDWAEGEVKPLYTAPQSKPWVGLTDEECRHFNNRLSGSGVAEDIEFELKERNK